MGSVKKMFNREFKETIDSILERRLVIPVFEKDTMLANGETPFNMPIHKRIDLNKVIYSMIKDIARLTKKGSIRQYSDEYYSNYEAVMEAKGIEDKYFGEQGFDFREFI